MINVDFKFQYTICKSIRSFNFSGTAATSLPHKVIFTVFFIIIANTIIKFINLA